MSVATPTGAGTTTTTPSVVLRGVTLARGSVVALRDVDLELPGGCVTALIGPNGAGKSTLLHGIAGLLRPRAGTIDVPVGRSGVAYVLQSAHADPHLPVTVREIVTMGRYAERGVLRPLRRIDRAVVDEALHRLDIADLARRQVRELSGGQRQRVFVARGLAQQAPVLLLDEPVTGLDLVSRRVILDVIRSERELGRVVVMSTHDLGEAAHADQVALLAGRVVASGPPSAVLTAEHLSVAYAQRLIRLDGGVLMLDDAPHHHHHDEAVAEHDAPPDH
ncbi:MAG TPA: zinc ABC transporter ATP-binding protein AztA [Acidimicrobiales bacterium]|nr:zinc ABC transporter ATP-binding protein AztA [Acidimicrobiales bacterium]